MNPNKITIAGLCGSLRKASYNLMLLKNAAAFAAENGMDMQIIPFDHLPFYNADNDMPSTTERPLAVKTFRENLVKADGLFIASPEYNYSIPGPLKNAFDWASRGNDSPLKKKPVALVGASSSAMGTVRMQVHFLSLFLYMDMLPVYQPEVLIAHAETKFDAAGLLTDEKAKELLVKKILALKELITKQ